MKRERTRAKEIINLYFPHECKTLDWLDYMEDFLIKLNQGKLNPQKQMSNE